MSKYFITRSQYHANTINYMTGEKYMKFTDNDGIYFSFIKTDNILKANKLIQDFKRNLI